MSWSSARSSGRRTCSRGTGQRTEKSSPRKRSRWLILLLSPVARRRISIRNNGIEYRHKSQEIRRKKRWRLWRSWMNSCRGSATNRKWRTSSFARKWPGTTRRSNPFLNLGWKGISSRVNLLVCLSYLASSSFLASLRTSSTAPPLSRWPKTTKTSWPLSISRRTPSFPLTSERARARSSILSRNRWLK